MLLKKQLTMTKKTENTLDIKKIIEVVAETATNSYGVVAIANPKADYSRSQKTKKGKAEEGIIVKRKSDGAFALDVYLVLAQGIKITEALRECHKSIKYKLDKVFPKLCREVNVFALEISAN